MTKVGEDLIAAATGQDCIDALIERLRENASKPCGTDCCYTETMTEAADALAKLRGERWELEAALKHAWDFHEAEIAKLREALEKIADGVAVFGEEITIARSALGESEFGKFVLSRSMGENGND